MSVIDCPVCGHRVNADASHCPECGADPRLASDEARAELATRHPIPTARPVGPPLPQWSRRRRALVLVAGLILPVVCAVIGALAFINGLTSNPADIDGDPLPSDYGSGLGAALVLFAIFLAALALGAALPGRLDSGSAAIVLIGSLSALGLVTLLTVLLGGTWLSLAVCLPFAYVPVLTVVRLVWQSHVGGSPPLHQAGIARPTSAST